LFVRSRPIADSSIEPTVLRMAIVCSSEGDLDDDIEGLIRKVRWTDPRRPDALSPEAVASCGNDGQRAVLRRQILAGPGVRGSASHCATTELCGSDDWGAFVRGRVPTPDQVVAAGSPAPTAPDPRLALQQLLDAGVITSEEFQQLSARVNR
jgi:hypothetical protein